MTASKRSFMARLMIGGFLIGWAVEYVQALELEPGLYRNAPMGTNALSVGYAYSGGNILADDSEVPIENAKAHVQGALLGYARYFNLFGRTARVDAATLVAWSHYEGTVAGQFMTRDPQGLADPRFRFAVNLAGAPALERSEFKNYQQKAIWGMSLMLAAPLGQYDSSRLINLGSNRWSIRPETGVSYAWKEWCAEGAAGTWVFTTNHDYYGGNELTQQPIGYLKGDLIYSFRKKTWIALNYGWATGGRTSVNGAEKADLQTNYRLGGTLTFSLSSRDSLVLNYSNGIVTRTGANFQSLATVFSHTWGS